MIVVLEANAMPNVESLLRDHVTLQVDCIDRLFLNGYVPLLQRPENLWWFLHEHRNHPVISPALVKKITDSFVTSIQDFAERHNIPVVHFEPDQRKEDIAGKHLARMDFDRVRLLEAPASASGRRRRPGSRPLGGGFVLPPSLAAWDNVRAMDDELIAIILGGGRGTRLFPLTFKRSKPAVPIAGKYRLIDIPISNCINSNVRRIFVLTQFNSESLNQHISRTYKFDIFSDSFVSILAAEQTEEGDKWFQGTADAVRQSLRHMRRHIARHVLILSGDQLYKMDYRTMLDTHRRTSASCTVGVIPVAADQASQFGILKMDDTGRIVHFEEKPSPERLPHLVSEIPGVGPGFLASMGIYIFERKTMERELALSPRDDFGRHIIPDAVPKMHVQAHVHQGYWEDVGTIRSYFQANLALTDPLPPFDFYQAGAPVYSHPRFLPASKVSNCTVHNALISEGCIILGAEIDRSVIGIRSRIGSGAQLHNSLVSGADAYETLEQLAASHAQGIPPMGIGSDSIIRNAIIDKNARIGRGVKILNSDGAREKDGDGYFIREGIVCVPKNAVLVDGTTI